MLAKLLVVVVLVHASHAFFLSRDNRVLNAGEREVDPECLAKAEAGSCDYYTCFEQRFPCGREWYILRYGHYYCNKMVTNAPRFSEAGQRFLSAARQCMTQSLRVNYTQDSMDCHDLEHRAVDAIGPCFTSNGFCSIVSSDAGELSRLYEFSDLFSAGSNKVMRAIIRIGLQCSSEFLSQMTQGARQSFMEGFSNIFS